MILSAVVGHGSPFGSGLDPIAQNPRNRFSLPGAGWLPRPVHLAEVPQGVHVPALQPAVSSLAFLRPAGESVATGGGGPERVAVVLPVGWRLPGKGGETGWEEEAWGSLRRTLTRAAGEGRRGSPPAVMGCCSEDEVGAFVSVTCLTLLFTRVLTVFHDT